MSCLRPAADLPQTGVPDLVSFLATVLEEDICHAWYQSSLQLQTLAYNRSVIWGGGRTSPRRWHAKTGGYLSVVHATHRLTDGVAARCAIVYAEQAAMSRWQLVQSTATITAEHRVVHFLGNDTFTDRSQSGMLLFDLAVDRAIGR